MWASAEEEHTDDYDYSDYSHDVAVHRRNLKAGGSPGTCIGITHTESLDAFLQSIWQELSNHTAICTHIASITYGGDYPQAPVIPCNDSHATGDTDDHDTEAHHRKLRAGGGAAPAYDLTPSLV